MEENVLFDPLIVLACVCVCMCVCVNASVLSGSVVSKSL